MSSTVKAERSLSDAGSSQATTSDDGVDEIQGKIIQLCAEYPKGMLMAERVGMMHVWVGSPNFGRTLAPKRIESPATLQIEDNFKGFPTITYFF